MQASIDKANQLKEEGKIEIYTKYQLDSVQGKEKVDSIAVEYKASSRADTYLTAAETKMKKLLIKTARVIRV
jgi:hypothetical protein